MDAELLLLAYAGLLLHALGDWKAYNDGSKIFPGWKRQIPSFLSNILTITLLVYVKEDIKNLYVITPFGAILLGYAGQSIFSKLLAARMPKDQKQADT